MMFFFILKIVIIKYLNLYVYDLLIYGYNMVNKWLKNFDLFVVFCCVCDGILGEVLEFLVINYSV